MNFNTPGVQPPAFQPQFGYPAPQYQSRGPPPTKKPKGNPIITRYPPPPGYKPPTVPFQQPAWQQPPPNHGYQYPYQGAYQQPHYNQSASYHGFQAPYPGNLPSQHFANAYSPYQNGYPYGSQAGWPGYATSPQSAPAVTDHQYSNPFDHVPRRHSSAPYPHQSYGVEVTDGNDEPYPPRDTQSPTGDGLEEDYDGESYFARHPDEINPELSLGLIEWKAPLPTKRPLPSTFKEAELEALAPRMSRPSDNESISEYYIDSCKDEALNSVRLSDRWNLIKDDLIFKEFPAVCKEVLSMYELISMYRDRIDPAWEAGERASPTPDPSRDPTPLPESERGDSMDIETDRFSIKSNHAKTNTDCQMLDDLENALGNLKEPGNSSQHSRSTSVTSQNLPRFKRPKPLPPVRDRAQEDKLAALGVTGSPKLVYETPGPAFGPPPEPKSSVNSRTNSISSSRHNSQGVITGIPQHSVPERVVSPSHESREHHPSTNNHHAGRPRSASSQQATAGSDFRVDYDNNATPRPKPQRKDSRKRGYVDSEDENNEDYMRQDDEETPKQRKKQARVGHSPR